MIEIMVGIAIALIATVIIIQVWSVAGSYQRSASGGSDAQQTAAVAMYSLDRIIKQAGAGLAQGNRVWACELTAEAPGINNMILPRAVAFPDPFADVKLNLRVSPVVIYSSSPREAGSDVLAVMAGASESGNVDFTFGVSSAAGVSEVFLNNSVAFRGKDYLLAVEQIGTAPGPCALSQVDASYAEFQVEPARRVPLSFALNPAFSGEAELLNLGRSPSLMLFGINNLSRLVQFDALNLAGLVPAPITATTLAENVFALKALYGTGPANGTVVTDWVDPLTLTPDTLNPATGAAAATVNAAANAIATIKAVRLALVVRGSEISGVAPVTSVALFQDLAPALRVTMSIPAAQQRYAYHVYETVIPLRNTVFAPSPPSP